MPSNSPPFVLFISSYGFPIDAQQLTKLSFLDHSGKLVASYVYSIIWDPEEFFVIYFTKF